jgi:adenylate cyclase
VKYKIFICLFALLSLPLIFQSQPTEILKLKFFDAFVEQKEPSNFFTILNLDEEFIADEGGWPLPRQRLAEIHVDILNAEALGVGWVISFPQPDRMGGDAVFAEVLNYGGSVLAMFENPNGSYPETSGTVLLGPDVGGMMSQGVVQNIDVLKLSADQGIATAPVDVDQLVRRIPLLLRTPDGFVSAFGTEVMKMLVGNNTYIIKTNDNGIEEITVQGLAPVKTDSLGRKWISWVDTPETTLEELDVANKFVFIGVTASGIMPQIATPVGLLEPHKIQAALSESILIPDSPYIPDFAFALEILIFAIFVTLTWLSINYLGVVKGISLAGVLLLTNGFSSVFLIKKGILIDFTWTFVSQVLTSATAFYINYRKQYKLRQQIKKQFEHYLDPRQIAILQKTPEALKLGGEKRYCTFLFTDVRGFTALSETLEPEEVTNIMNRALTIQSNAVKKYGGMVDKYIGDAMMAIFNAPIDLDHHEDMAIEAALQIMQDMKEANIGVNIGIGINSGEACVGNMGSDTRFDYSAIGDAVNTAARLESATKNVGVDLIIGHNTKKSCNFKLELLKPIKVKGKKESLAIYTIK